MVGQLTIFAYAYGDVWAPPAGEWGPWETPVAEVGHFSVRTHSICSCVQAKSMRMDKSATLITHRICLPCRLFLAASSSTEELFGVCLKTQETCRALIGEQIVHLQSCASRDCWELLMHFKKVYSHWAFTAISLCHESQFRGKLPELLRNFSKDTGEWFSALSQLTGNKPPSDIREQLAKSSLN